MDRSSSLMSWFHLLPAPALVSFFLSAAFREAVRMLAPELVEKLKSSQIMLCDIEAR